MAKQPLIRNYGLFWKAEDVYWGGGRNAGALYGVLAGKGAGDEVDFRNQRGIYVLYADYDLVYVGQNNSSNLLTRLKQHRNDDLAGRWNRVSWFGMRAVLKKGHRLAKFNETVHVSRTHVLNHIEGILIHAAEPRLNRQGGKFGKNIERYLQVRDDRLGPNEKEILRELYKQKKKVDD